MREGGIPVTSYSTSHTIHRNLSLPLTFQQRGILTAYCPLSFIWHPPVSLHVQDTKSTMGKPGLKLLCDEYGKLYHNR